MAEADGADLHQPVGLLGRERGRGVARAGRAAVWRGG